MKKFIQLFKKVGGGEILRQYRQGHVLLFSFLITVLLGFSKKSLEIVRLAVDNRRLSKLRKRYKAYIANYVKTHQDVNPRTRSNKIWFLWLQGMENAPELVRGCYRSLQRNISDREIVLLTEYNYREFVTFPDYIQQKIDLGEITKTHMSDLLRLELLNSYGGTWIDATVYCSGNNIPDYMLDSDLFLFQSLKPGLDGKSTCISSWFITASANHPILLLTQSLLYNYWKNNTRMLDYFLFHDFFQLAIEAYSEEWNKIVPFSNSVPHILLLRLFDIYEEKIWNALRTMVPFHKLTYKFEKNMLKERNTYYDVIFEDEEMEYKGRL